jgi:hypothetical protein
MKRQAITVQESTDTIKDSRSIHPALEGVKQCGIVFHLALLNAYREVCSLKP